MGYVRKTRDEYEIQGLYDHDIGYELLTTEETFKEARNRKVEYLMNDRYLIYCKVVKKRVRVNGG